MSTFRFIDLPTAAEVLGVSRQQALAYVEGGRLKPYQGIGQAAVFRARDVQALLAELGVEAAAALPTVTRGTTAATPDAPDAVAQAGRRRTDTIRRDPVKKVGTRLTQDVRWAEITEADLAAWFDGLDTRSYPAVRHAARQALLRLTRILELTGGAGETQGDRDLTDSGRVVSAKEILNS